MFDESRSTNESVAGWIDSLKVAVAAVDADTFADPGAGDSAVTIGGVVSEAVALKTTSTQ